MLRALLGLALGSLPASYASPLRTAAPLGQSHVPDDASLWAALLDIVVDGDVTEPGGFRRCVGVFAPGLVRRGMRVDRAYDAHIGDPLVDADTNSGLDDFLARLSTAWVPVQVLGIDAFASIVNHDVPVDPNVWSAELSVAYFANEARRCTTYVLLLDGPRHPQHIRDAVNGSLLSVRGEDPLARLVVAWRRGPPSDVLLNATTAAVWSVAAHLNAVVLAAEGAHYAVYGFDPYDARRGCGDSAPRLVATWRPSAGLSARGLFPLAAGSAGLRQARRLRLSGCTLRTLFVAYAFKSTTLAADGTWLLTGPIAEALPVLEAVHDVKLQLADDSECLQRLYRGEVDVCIGPGYMGDYKIFNATTCGWHARWCFTWAIPVKFRVRKPFHWRLTGEYSFSTWMLLAVSLLLSYGVAAVLLRYQSKLTKEIMHGARARWVLAAMVSATLVGSPLARPIHGHPTRAFLCCWLFVGIVVCTGYLASLKSIVAVPSEPRPIRDVEELADHTEIPLCGPWGVVREGILQLSKISPHYKKIAERFVPITLDKMPTAMQSNGVFEQTSWFDDLQRKGSLDVLSGCVFSLYAFPMLVRRGSVLALPFSHTLVRMQQAGLFDFWSGSKRTRPDGSSKTLSSAPIALGLKNLDTMFYIYAAALVVPTLILAAEMFAHRIQLRQRRPGTPPGSLADGCEDSGSAHSGRAGDTGALLDSERESSLRCVYKDISVREGTRRKTL